jgi:hypothetical protein
MSEKESQHFKPVVFNLEYSYPRGYVKLKEIYRMFQKKFYYVKLKLWDRGLLEGTTMKEQVKPKTHSIMRREPTLVDEPNYHGFSKSIVLLMAHLTAVDVPQPTRVTGD